MPVPCATGGFRLPSVDSAAHGDRLERAAKVSDMMLRGAFGAAGVIRRVKALAGRELHCGFVGSY
jgi:hypothetical protein